MMKINEIRQLLACKQHSSKSPKRLLRDWLAYECDVDFNFGLTLMPKKLLDRHLTKTELESACYRFLAILNRLVYKNAYLRYNKKLDVVMAIEGERSFKDLHAHFALAKPDEMPVKQFVLLVHEALHISNDFVIENAVCPNRLRDDLSKRYRYKLDAVNSGWITYITKELDKRSMHSLYLP